MKLNTVKTSGMRAQAGVKQTSTTEQLKRESHACKLKQRPTRDVVLACATGTATLPLAEAGTEGIVDVSPQHRTRGAFRIDSHLMDTLQRQALLRVSRHHSGSLSPQSKTIADD